MKEQDRLRSPLVKSGLKWELLLKNQNWALTEAMEFSLFYSIKNFGIHYKAAELKIYIYIYISGTYRLQIFVAFL